MLKHYFQETMSDSQISRVIHAVEEQKVELTPAQVEQIAAEHESIESMVTAIEDSARPKIQFKA